MEFFGKIIAALPKRTGTSARSGKAWTSQEFVIENQSSRYPQRMVFNVFGEETLARLNIQVGTSYNVTFDIDAHEYNGRWFNSINAYAAVPAMQPAQYAAPAQPAVAPAPQQGAVFAQPQQQPQQIPPQPQQDGLPF